MGLRTRSRLNFPTIELIVLRRRKLGEHIAVVIDWYGPWHWSDNSWRGEAPSAESSEQGHAGLYIAIQKNNKSQWARYVGMTNSKAAQRVKPRTHHVLKTLDKFELWIGEATNAQMLKESLLAAEWAHTFGLIPKPDLNVLKTGKPPSTRLTIINLWRKSASDQRKTPPHPDWPNRLDFIYRSRSEIEINCWSARPKRSVIYRREDRGWKLNSK